MNLLSRDVKPLLDHLSAATRRPQTARRLILFFAAAILVVGDRAVSGVLRLLQRFEPLNASTFPRLCSKGRAFENDPGQSESC